MVKTYSGKGGKGKGGKVNESNQKRSFWSKSSKAGLQFPVGRVHRYIKNRLSNKNRVGASSAVYWSAIL